MTRRTAVLYCNADLAQGMGHLARSLSLSEEARRRGWETIIAGQFGGRAIEHAAALAPNQEIVLLEAGSPLQQLRKLVDARSAQLLHLDSYDTRLDTFDPGAVLVSNMQDGTFGRRQADLHIDANLDAELRYQSIQPNERVIVGTSGMQIRSAVRRLNHEVRQPLSAPFNVLVILGGTDPLGLTPRITRLLLTHPELNLTVICRPEVRPDLVEALGDKATRRVAIISFTESLPELANSMDIVVTAAGTSVWDFAAVGIPMGIIAVTENQLPGYRACETHQLGFMLGEPPHDLIEEQIDELVCTLQDRAHLEGLSARGALLVDGLGAWRVVSAWEEMLEDKALTRAVKVSELAPKLNARAAVESDARQLFEWRNDESTRAVSRSHQSIQWEDHLAWLRRTIADPERKLLVIEDEHAAIATMRWDQLRAHTWEASITIAPSHRGRGHGSIVLSAGESVFSSELPVRLTAGIHESNHASRRLFARAGYLPYAPADSAGFETREKWLLR